MSYDIDELAREAAGNWRKFESFGWHDQPDDSENWTIIRYTPRGNRLDESSAKILQLLRLSIAYPGLTEK